MANIEGLILHGAPENDGRGAFRAAERASLSAALAQVNERYGVLLAEPFVLHEDGLVFGRPLKPRALTDLLQALDLGPEPLRVRWGIGWGPSDGRAGAGYRRAQEALARSRGERRWVTVGGLGEERDLTLNALFLLLQVFRSGWTARQREAVATRCRHVTQKAAARELTVEKSLMSRRLKAAHYPEWREGLLAVRLLLKHWLEDGAGAS
jgi:hypothetical protein